jgi:hypothetical protein
LYITLFDLQLSYSFWKFVFPYFFVNLLPTERNDSLDSF